MTTNPSFKWVDIVDLCIYDIEWVCLFNNSSISSESVGSELQCSMQSSHKGYNCKCNSNINYVECEVNVWF